MAAILLSLSAQHAVVEVNAPAGRLNHAVHQRMGGRYRTVEVAPPITEEQAWRMGRGGGMWMEDQMRNNPFGAFVASRIATTHRLRWMS